MKETRELQTAREAREVARDAFEAKASTVRSRLAPHLLAAELAEMLAARAGSMMLKRGITRKRRIGAAVGGAAALASAVVLRAAHKAKLKKSGDLPPERG